MVFSPFLKFLWQHGGTFTRDPHRRSAAARTATNLLIQHSVKWFISMTEQSHPAVRLIRHATVEKVGVFWISCAKSIMPHGPIFFPDTMPWGCAAP